MSSMIDLDDVSAVLLSDGRWYKVDGGTFSVDPYGFTYEGKNFGPGGLGFSFDGRPIEADPELLSHESESANYAGPMSAIVAVRRPARD